MTTIQAMFGVLLAMAFFVVAVCFRWYAAHRRALWLQQDNAVLRSALNHGQTLLDSQAAELRTLNARCAKMARELRADCGSPTQVMHTAKPTPVQWEPEPHQDVPRSTPAPSVRVLGVRL